MGGRSEEMELTVCKMTLMVVNEQNKWDIRWLKAGDKFRLDLEASAVTVDWRPDNGYLNLGDGLYVRAEAQQDGVYEYLMTVWARSEDYLRYFCLSNSAHPAALPDATSEQFPNPPDMPGPLDFGTITDLETVHGRSWYMDGLLEGRFFHHKILQTKTDMHQRTGYYLLGRRDKRSDIVHAITWRYRNPS